jgi:hypothetical protein
MIVAEEDQCGNKPLHRIETARAETLDLRTGPTMELEFIYFGGYS